MLNEFPQNCSHFKLIVSDVDGTLMGKDRIISEKTSDAIRRWQKAGKMFSIASGRQYFMLKDDIKSLEITTPVIVRGGSEIVDPTTDKVLYSQNIDRDTLRNFCNTLLSHKYDVMVEKDDLLFGSYEYDISMYPLLTLKKLDEFKWQDAPKVNVPLGDRTINEFDKYVEYLVDLFPDLNIMRSYNDMGKSLDVTSKKATKHLAVLELSKLVKVDYEDTVGVGDGFNDFPLLAASGFKVAMGNGREELKEIADVVVPGFKEDGVAFLIEKLLEKN